MIERWLSYHVLGSEVWRYGVVLLLFLGAFVLYRLFRIIARRLSPPEAKKKVRWPVLDLIQSLLRSALPFLGIWLSIHVFRVPDNVQEIIDQLFLAALTIFILYFVTKSVDMMTVFLKRRAARTESTLDEHLVPLLGKVLKWFIWTIGFLLFLQNILHYNISSLLAGLGIGGLALAFAAQDTIANIFGAVMIFIDRPFKVGDAVAIEGFEGSIEAIGVRSTRLRTWDGTLVMIPNRTVASTNINNLAARPMRRTNFTIGLIYSTSTTKLEEALTIVRETLEKHPSTGQYRAYFNRFGDFSLNILVQYWCNVMDYEIYLRSLEEINMEIKRRFEAARIEFAFPTQTLYLKPEH